jgi:hypothetical protein
MSLHCGSQLAPSSKFSHLYTAHDLGSNEIGWIGCKHLSPDSGAVCII